MKKFKSLSFAVVAALLLLGAGPLQPAFADCRGASLATKSTVAVSTTIGSPTTLIAAGALGTCQEVWVMLNWSGTGTKPNGEYLLLSDTSTGISSSTTTGTFRIPAGNSPSEFFRLGEYAGPLFAIAQGTTSALNVSILKKK